MRKVKIPKSQIFCFILIIIVCIIAIVEALYYVMNPNALENKNADKDSEDNNTISNVNLAENFDDIFKNTFKDSNTSEKAKKIQEDKDYIYTEYEKNEVNSGNYEVNVKIPIINIDSEEVKSYNEDIKKVFKDKAESILNGGANKSIYSVDYEAYLNNNILSIIIRSTLKEGNNPQRVIIQTYCYNVRGANKSIYSVDYEAYLNNNILSIIIRSTLKEGNNPQRVIIQTYCYNVKDMKKVEFAEIMQMKNLDKNMVQEKIKRQIQGKQEEANTKWKIFLISL